ncbi:MAG: hypothetical protein C5B51_28115 [Terriglobia bacterium]|nr:MAG: hypothetical protein C5B51_28115 [Terriglobia bacterium]
MWLAGLITGGRWTLIHSFLRNPRRPEAWIDQLSWTPAFVSGAAAAVALGWLRRDIAAVLTALTGPLLICYAAGKCACMFRGCCGLRPSYRWSGRSLPMFEAIWSAALASALLWIATPAAAGAALIGHGVVRAAGRVGRGTGSSTTALLDPSAAATILGGGLIVASSVVGLW